VIDLKMHSENMKLYEICQLLLVFNVERTERQS